MSDNSLLINGLETIGYDVNPEYHLGAGLDFGSIAPDTTTISSLLLDGDVVTGERTGNKTWNLIVVVIAPDRPTLSVYVDALMQAVNTDTYPVVWTPDSCPSTTFTAFRATAVPAKRFAYNDADEPFTEVTLQFATGPFGESDGQQTITVPAAGGATQLVVDAMDAGTFTAGTRDTTHKYLGASCMAFTMTRTNSSRSLGGQVAELYGYISPVSPVAGRSITSVDLSSYQAISLRLRWDQAPTNWTVNATLSLKDDTGTIVGATTAVSITDGDISYRLVRFPLSKFAAFDLTQVTAWSVGIQTANQIIGNAGSFPATRTAYVDDLRVYPMGSASNSTGEGSVLTIPGVVGSARTPVSIELDLAGAAFTSALVHRPPVTQDPDAAILLGLALSGGSYVASILAANANHSGSYSVVLIFSAAVTSTRTITVTFTHKIGATVIGTWSYSYTTFSGKFQQVLGEEVVLPVCPTPPENQSDTLTVTVTSSNPSDVISDVALLHTEGQTVLVAPGSPGVKALWIDPPDPLVGIGPVYAAQTIDRNQSSSQMANVSAYSGGPMLFDPGDNRLLVLTPQGAPGVTVAYTPRWLDEAIDQPVAVADVVAPTLGAFGAGDFGSGDFGGF